MRDNDEENYNGSNKSNKSFKYIIVFGLMILSFIAGNYVFRYGFIIGTNSSEYRNSVKMVNKFPEFNTLFEVREDLEKLYNGKIDDKKLAENATKVMTDSLGDKYTVYMTKDEYKKYMKSSSSSYTGIGVYVTVSDNKVVISGLVAGGTAEKAGIKSGDVIEAVNNEKIGNDLDKAVSLITQKNNTTLTLSIERKGEGTININVTTGKIQTSSVEGKMVSDKVGYIRLMNFNKDCSKQFTKMLNKLSDKGMKGLILDLRNNGGGYLDEAINIGSDFIPKDKIITYTIDKYNKKVVYTSKGTNIKNIPIVILTNGETASASEVLTGALRDHKIATTVGETTFGKGIVQEIFPLSVGDGGLKVTVSKYYTPNGKNIHGKGIKADSEVKLSDKVSVLDYTTQEDNQFQQALIEIGEKVN